MLDIRHDSHIPLVNQVVQAIEALVAERAYAAEEPIPSERMLSEQLGVSRATVRSAIGQLVERHVLYRVPGAGTFVVANGEDDLFPSAAYSAAYVAVSIPNMKNPWFAEMAQSIQQALRKNELGCVLNVADYSAAEEVEFLKQLQRERVIRGLIIAPVVERGYPVEVYARLREAGIPFVFVSHFVPGVDADYVVADGQAGAYEAVAYLIRLGHQRIGYVYCKPKEASHVHNSRLAGYIQAMQAHGLEPLPVPDFECAQRDMPTGYRAMDELLRHNPRPTAVLAVNDIMAFGVFRRLHEEGLRVPEDMSVIGIDNTAMAAAWEVPLTSVDPSADTLGAVAVNVLMDRLKRADDMKFQRIALHPHLVVRGSCCAPTS